jgi:4-amino-4-deoxy-L-arabinose transferase-like glycosyltransferase/membrane-associated phospholipid phosphatase
VPKDDAADGSTDCVSTTEVSRASKSRLRWWVRFHFVSLAAAGLAWCIDDAAFQFFDRWYNGPKPPNGELHQLILSSAMFGQGLGMVLSVMLIWLLDRRRYRAATIALVLAASGLASSTGKMVVGRERPLESRGASVFHGPWKGPYSSRQQSMPSGHTTTAAALAVVLTRFYPALRGLMIALVLGVGLNRVVTVAHYPSDIVVGAWLGTCVSMWLLGRVWLRAASMTLASRAAAVGVRLADLAASGQVRLRRGARRALASPWLPTVAGLALFWAGNGSTPLWDRDEPRFATAAREMLERNDWIVPTFNGDLRPDKPIFVYWLMMISYSVFGVGPFAARFFSGLFGASAVLSTYLLGRSMFDRRVGLTAAWVLALSPMVIVEAKLCTADGVLFGFLTFGFFCLWRMASGVGGTWTSIGLWTALAFACLTKGPVAVGVLGVTAFFFSILARDFVWLKTLGYRRGVAILFVVLAPWCYMVQDSTNGEFLAVSLGRHVVERSTSALENHRGFPGYYIVSIFLLMSPWGWALPWAVHRHGRRLFEDRRLAFLTAWLVGPLLMFEAVRTKLVHYYLPSYPAAALLLASAWVGRFAGSPLGVSTIRPWLGWTTAFAGLIVAGTVVATGCVFFPQELATPGALSVGLFGAAVVGSGVLLTWRMPRPAFRTMAFGAWASLTIAVTEFLPALGSSRPIYEVAHRLKERRAEPIAFWNYRDPSMIFNLGGGVYPIVDPLRGQAPLTDSRHLAAWTPFLCPMTPELYADMSGDRALRLEIVETVSKWDGGNLRPRTVHIVRVAPAEAAVAAQPSAAIK